MHPPRPSPLTPLAAATAALAAGCAPALSTLHPAHVPARGHVQAELGADVSIPTGGVVDLVDAAEALAAAAESRALSDEEERAVFQAGASLAVNPPAPSPHLGVGYAPLDHLEARLRLGAGAYELGLRYQLLRRARHGVDLSVGGSGSRFTYAFPVSDVVGVLRLEDFERWQLAGGVHLGISSDWYRTWGGLKAAHTFFGTELVLEVPFTHELEVAAFDGRGTYLGGVAGVALGYRAVFVALELTVAQFFGSADATVLGAPAFAADLDTLVLVPALGVLVEL